MRQKAAREKAAHEAAARTRSDALDVAQAALQVHHRVQAVRQRVADVQHACTTPPSSNNGFKTRKRVMMRKGSLSTEDARGWVGGRTVAPLDSELVVLIGHEGGRAGDARPLEDLRHVLHDLQHGRRAGVTHAADSRRQVERADHDDVDAGDGRDLGEVLVGLHRLPNRTVLVLAWVGVGWGEVG